MLLEQPVLQGEVGHNLLQSSSLATEILHLAGRGSCRVARHPALAGLKELLGPAIVHRGDDAQGADGEHCAASAECNVKSNTIEKSVLATAMAETHWEFRRTWQSRG